MIKEYRTDPEAAFGSNDQGMRTRIFEWQSFRSIDLRYVTSARPVEAYRLRWTAVTLVGDAAACAIDVEYEAFCRDWQSVKR